MLNISIIIFSSILIILYLLQDGKTEGFLNSSQIYKNAKERGPEKIVFWITGAISLLFMVLVAIGGLS